MVFLLCVFFLLFPSAVSLSIISIHFPLCLLVVTSVGKKGGNMYGYCFLVRLYSLSCWGGTGMMVTGDVMEERNT